MEPKRVSINVRKFNIKLSDGDYNDIIDEQGQSEIYKNNITRNSSGMDKTSNEYCVNEGAFWHSNMDLYYGYQPGEVVEVEHESNKYWLATIEYSFKHLILLKWVGNYGEFWVETSNQNSFNNNSSTIYNNEFNYVPKRLFPPGYHLQSRLKSQFTLERPSKVLIKPSSYNPANDPYAEIKTVDDLLTHEIDQNNIFESQSSTSDHQPASLVLAKCKTKIDYGQEDVDELEAALQNLNDIDSNETKARVDSPDNFETHNECHEQNTDGYDDNNIKVKNEEENCNETSIQKDESFKSELKPLVNDVESSGIDDGSTPTVNQEITKFEDKLPATTNNTITGDDEKDQSKQQVDHEAILEACKSLQESAISKGRYLGMNENNQNVYYLKPKQFFDMGGANHERVFVPGTLLEISHTLENESGGLDLCHWVAIVLKNVGGRLTLRWFLCDEPKFKQGRLELKSCRSEFISEEEELENTGDAEDEPTTKLQLPKTKLSVKDLTFSMHFCNPCVHSINHGKTVKRPYKVPSFMSAMFEQNTSDAQSPIESQQLDYVFDIRRQALDKDRPIIDHLLSTVRWKRPQYINISFANKDTHNYREVLLSTPKATKLLKGYIKRELESGVFEVHSEPSPETCEVVKFIYPYDSSYSILPTNWAINNQDCLSIHPSRNPTPTLTDKLSSNGNSEANSSKESEQIDLPDTDPHPSETESDLKQSLQPDPANINNYTLLCEIPKWNFYEHEVLSIPDMPQAELTEDISDFDEMDPSCWSRLIRARELHAPEFQCNIDYTTMDRVLARFRVMDQLEVVHPSSDVTICLGRIRKVVYPLLWIQISADSYTLLPFNSTDIYPSGWCESNNHPLISLLPPRKRINQSLQSDKKRKKAKTTSDLMELDQINDHIEVYEKEHFDLGALNDKQMELDYILNEKSMYIRIYFNHKCFTGPSLSKGKICSLPQYVGPGPLRLVIEEVVTKVISVAYVPPRILNDLSSKSFEELLIARNLTNTGMMEFKAKYQKRVHREEIPVCLNPDDVALYCECVCEHLKCCYNLFGPDLYDGDDCPGHCRALTKSNKFMKRATYYREKARLGEFTNDNNGNAKKLNNNSSNKTSRARYAGRDSSESTSSSLSRSEQLNSRASSAGDEIPVNESKENLVAVEEEMVIEDGDAGNDCPVPVEQEIERQIEGDVLSDSINVKEQQPQSEMDKILPSNEQVEHSAPNVLTCKPQIKWPNEFEFNMIDIRDSQPDQWTVEDVAVHLEWCRLGRFKPYMVSENVDGQALLLMDKVTIREHFQYQKSEYTLEEVGKLCRFVEFVKARAEVNTGV